MVTTEEVLDAQFEEDYYESRREYHEKQKAYDEWVDYQMNDMRKQHKERSI